MFFFIAGASYMNISAVKASIMSVRRPKFVLSVGPHYADLTNGPSNNCTAIEKALKHNDKSWAATSLTGTEATKEAFLSALKAMVQQVNAIPLVAGFDGEMIAPVVMVFLAGHAGQAGTEQYFQPYSSTPIDNKVYQKISLHEVWSIPLMYERD